jgi:hypothetical protein
MISVNSIYVQQFADFNGMQLLLGIDRVEEHPVSINDMRSSGINGSCGQEILLLISHILYNKRMSYTKFEQVHDYNILLCKPSEPFTVG